MWLNRVGKSADIRFQCSLMMVEAAQSVTVALLIAIRQTCRI